MLNNQDIWRIAMQQSAYDCNCVPEDFLAEQNVVTISKKHPLARKYLDLPLSCDLVSYGSNIVAQASEEIAPLVKQYMYDPRTAGAAWVQRRSRVSVFRWSSRRRRRGSWGCAGGRRPGA